MWVTRSLYLELVAKNASLTTSVQWLTARVNQLEKRNAMLEAKCGFPPVEVPEIVYPVPNAGVSEPRQGALASEAPSLRDIFAGNINFEDMGDERAATLGISHDSSGLLAYHR